MIVVFEVIEITGFGTIDSPFEEKSTDLFYTTPEAAAAEADRLWKQKTTEEQRKDWCPLHYVVRERTIKQ